MFSIRGMVAAACAPVLVIGLALGLETGAGASAANGSSASTNTAVVVWGDNGYGQHSVPAGLTGVTTIAGGGYHSLALKSDGTVVTWGSNAYGLGSVPAGLTGVTAIAAGWGHSLALKSDGTVVGWGDNNYGQVSVPAGLTGVTAIAAGSHHSLALKSDGTVVGWGDNSSTQITVPAGLTGVTAIAAGWAHSLALKSDGTVVAWGSNAYGQAGVPTGLTGVTAIAAGAFHSLALRSDGTVVGWGYNGYGQASAPAGLAGVTAIAAGYYHSVALKSDGTVVAWGYNASGQATVPAGLSGITAVAAGAYHNLAVVAETVSVGDVSVTEGDTGSTPATFTIRLNWPAAGPVSLTYATEPGSAGPDDYAPSAGTVLFAAGQTSRTVTVPVTGDRTDEPNETFQLHLISASGADIGDGVGVATIIDNDPLPLLTIGDQTVTEGNAGTTLASFPLTLSNPSARYVSVDFVTRDGSAKAGSDYEYRTGTRLITPGDTGATISVPVVGDTKFEPDETFTVQLLDPSGATLGGAGSATGTISTDDEDLTPPTVEVTQPGSPFTLAASTSVRWTASDTESGLAGYQVRYRQAPYSAGFGPWVSPPAWQHLPAGTRSVTLTGLHPGDTYCFQVLALDKHGNSNRTAARCTARPLDDRALILSGHWSKSTGSSWWNHTVITSKTLGATAKRTGVQLDRVGIVATRGPGMGTVGVYVGSTLIGKINLAAAKTQPQALLTLPAFAYRSGTVTVKVLTSGKPVQLDGLATSRS